MVLQPEPVSPAGANGTASVPHEADVDVVPARSVCGFSQAEVFDILSNRRRRYTLHYLLGRSDRTVQMGDLASQIAAWESGVTTDELSYADRKTVHTALYQFHVPKLDALGVVDYDPKRGAVELTPTGRDLDIYLEAVQGHDIPWASYFLLLSLTTTALAVAAWFDVLLFARLPDVAAAGFAIVAFLVSSLAFASESRASMRLGSAGPPPEVKQR
jgi:hypothetical protein